MWYKNKITATGVDYLFIEILWIDTQEHLLGAGCNKVKQGVQILAHLYFYAFQTIDF